MVYIPPPHLAVGGRSSYGEEYSKIVATYRSSPLTSASSILVLVAPEVDALCAARMLSDLFNQDDVIHRIIPIPGFKELEAIKDELRSHDELHTLILFNIGGMVELASEDWFGSFHPKLTVHVIDSIRPQNLVSLFGRTEPQKRIIVWDDGGAEKLQEERKAFEALMYEPLVDSDDEDEYFDSEEENSGDDYDSGDQSSRKRRSLDNNDSTGYSKRRRIDRESRQKRLEEHDHYHDQVEKYYGGTHHGQSAAGTVYSLATVMERVDNDLLWFAILGLTYQYTTSRISREAYDTFHSVFYDEVSRLNPLPLQGEHAAHISLNPDDTSVRTTDELRFMLFRHWTLYDAMYHSGYVASKLGIWKERGRKRLTGLLAKMGFSIPQTQQPYSHMDMDLKRDLLHKLNDIAPEYGLVELSYPSFTRCYGYRSQPLSAADAVEGVRALLDVASGIRLEVEVEGSRNGGEWFGGGRVWETNVGREVKRGTGGRTESSSRRPEDGGDDTVLEVKRGEEVQNGHNEEGINPSTKWWVRNFWAGFDALNDIRPLHEALSLSMSLHRAIIRQGTSIIDKQDIRTMSNHRVVVLSQGPDLSLFAHPSILSRLALWLVDALRDRVPITNPGNKTKRKSLPFVVACLDENAGTYMVVGVMAALDFGDVRKNRFSLAFMNARDACNASTKHSSFDASILEIEQKDLKNFLDKLCEAPEI